MSRPPRYLPQGGALVEVTYRTIQGRMLLRPSRKLNEIVVGTLARAYRLCSEEARDPVELVGIVVLSNHIHLLLWVKTQYQLSKLLEHFAGNTTREVNRLHDWSGSLWQRRYQGICVTTEESAQVARLEYLLAQGVKEGLVEKVEDWPGIHFGKLLLERRSLLAGKWIDRTKKHRARARGKELRRGEYEETLTVELKQLPCWAHLSWREYLRRVRDLIKKIEKEAAAERELCEVELVGVQAICEKDPQTQNLGVYCASGHSSLQTRFRQVSKSPPTAAHLSRQSIHEPAASTAVTAVTWKVNVAATASRRQSTARRIVLPISLPLLVVLDMSSIRHLC